MVSLFVIIIIKPSYRNSCFSLQMPTPSTLLKLQIWTSIALNLAESDGGRRGPKFVKSSWVVACPLMSLMNAMKFRKSSSNSWSSLLMLLEGMLSMLASGCAPNCLRLCMHVNSSEDDIASCSAPSKMPPACEPSNKDDLLSNDFLLDNSWKENQNHFLVKAICWQSIEICICLEYNHVPPLHHHHHKIFDHLWSVTKF